MFTRFHTLMLAVMAATAAVVCAAPVPPDAGKKRPDTIDAVAAGGDAEVQRAQIRRSTNNLKQIGVAIHNHASAWCSRLPANIASKDGKPLLSWRIHILPFIEEDRLYEQFKLDEPWDSPNNIKLLEKIPAVLESPRVKVKKGYTVYQGFMGQTAISGKYTIGQIPDGTANTIWCVEATSAVPWTKPADIPFDAKKDPRTFGKAFGDKPLATLCDGSARTLDLKKIAADTLKSAIIPDDGMVLGEDW